MSSNSFLWLPASASLERLATSPCTTITTLPQQAFPERLSTPSRFHRSSGNHPYEQPTPRTILVVENDVRLQDMIKQALEMAGYRVLLQDDLTDSCCWIDRVLHDPPHLTLLDVSLRRPDPSAYLHAFHRRWQLHPPVIVLTTHTTVYADLSLIGYQVILKPFHLQTLFDTMRNALAREEAIRTTGNRVTGTPFLQEPAFPLLP